jgi:hypothetical protein
MEKELTYLTLEQSILWHTVRIETKRSTVSHLVNLLLTRHVLAILYIYDRYVSILQVMSQFPTVER